MLYDELPIAQKAAMMRVCIKNGITNPDDIRTAYNNYVEGRNIFDGLSESYHRASAFGQFLANGGRITHKFEIGGPTNPPRRDRMPAHPRNREKDPAAYDAAQQWQADMQQRRAVAAEQARIEAEQKAQRNAEAAARFNNQVNLVMGAMEAAATPPIIGEAIRQAAEKQRQEKVEKFHRAVDDAALIGKSALVGAGIMGGFGALGSQLGLGMVGGEGFDIGTQALTPYRNWGDMVSQTTGAPEWFGHLTNPGYFLPYGKIAKATTEFVSPAVEWANFGNAMNSEWYQNLVKVYGEEDANRIANYVMSAEGRNFFWGDKPKKAREIYDRFANQRDIIGKITGNVDEGKAAVAGSAAISHEGTINRSGAALHDLDVNAYMGNASKSAEMSSANQELWNMDKLSTSPIFKTISEAYPETFRQAKVRTTSKLHRKLEGLNRWWDNDSPFSFLPNPFPSSYREGVFNITPMYNISDAGANRVAMTKINGEPIDIFLSDRFIPIKDNFLTAENVLNWKRSFMKHRVRPKDAADLENYRPFSADNPVISTTGQTQYAPFSFKENVLINSEGLPILSPVETYPGSGTFIPTFMNYEGKFYPFMNLSK